MESKSFIFGFKEILEKTQFSMPGLKKCLYSLLIDIYMYFAVFKYHTKPPKCNQSIIFYHQISNFQSSGIRCKFCVFSFSSSTLMYMKNKQHKHVLRSLFHPKHNKYCSTFTINLHSFTHNHIYLLASKYILIYPIVAAFQRKCF